MLIKTFEAVLLFFSSFLPGIKKARTWKKSSADSYPLGDVKKVNTLVLYTFPSFFFFLYPPALILLLILPSWSREKVGEDFWGKKITQNVIIIILGREWVSLSLPLDLAVKSVGLFMYTKNIPQIAGRRFQGITYIWKVSFGVTHIVYIAMCCSALCFLTLTGVDSLKQKRTETKLIS